MAVVESIADPWLQCAVCSKDISDPALLACLHSCCQPCLPVITLSSPAAANDGAAQLPICPNCQLTWSQMLSGRGDTQKNGFLAGRIVLRQERSQVAECAICIEEGDPAVAASGRCLQCRKYLCQHCQRMHSRFLKWHTVVPVDEFRTGVLDPQSFPAPRGCCLHGAGVELPFYCSDCSSARCLDCLMSTCHREGHRYVPTCARVSAIKQKMEAQLAAVAANLAIVSGIKVQCDGVAHLLEEQKDLALLSLDANKRLLLRAIDERYLVIKARLADDVEELMRTNAATVKRCLKLCEVTQQSIGYARLLLEQGHHLHVIDQEPTVSSWLKWLGSSAAISNVSCPSDPAMFYETLPLDPGAIEQWLGAPHWTISAQTCLSPSQL